MPLVTTAGQVIVNDALPPELRRWDLHLDKKGLQELLRAVATSHPEQYRDVSKRLADIGRNVATESGGNSFGLSHLRKARAAAAIEQKLAARVGRILDDDRLTPKQRNELLIRAAGDVQGRQMDEVYAESLAEDNPLARQVVSGSRGNKMNLASLRGSDLLYTDPQGDVIPLPVARSYAQGLTPAEYWAGTYGARHGVVAVKMGTRDAGYFGKVLGQVAHRLVVTAADEPDPVDDDGKPLPRPLRGLPVDTADRDNAGALLAHDVGGYKRNTVLSPKILKDLQRRGHDRILVRSPAVGSSADGGVLGYDVGVREFGTIPGRGEQVGLAAAQSLAEPVSQATLGAKHTGGVAGQAKAVSGFTAFDQLVQVPKTFKGGAAHAAVDGTVERIETAPAGGTYVTVNGRQHHVARGFDLKVKRGDTVEAGDVLSEGLPNPAVIVEHKGIGEGRRYFVDVFRRTLTDAGLAADRRNVSLLARGLINHVRLATESGDHVPDDVVPYDAFERRYRPRDGTTTVRPDRAAGQYLERPVLHYSIGTPVRPSVVRELKRFGVKEVDVHAEPPPFAPLMVRGMANLQHDPDWRTRMYGSGLKTGLLEAVHRGGESHEAGTSFVPGLARAIDFGRNTGPVRPPQPGQVPPPLGQPLPSFPALPLPKPEPPPPPAAPPPPSRWLRLFKLSADARHLAKTAQEPRPPEPPPTPPLTGDFHQANKPPAGRPAANQPPTMTQPPTDTAARPSLINRGMNLLGWNRPPPEPPPPQYPVTAAVPWAARTPLPPPAAAAGGPRDWSAALTAESIPELAAAIDPHAWARLTGQAVPGAGGGGRGRGGFPGPGGFPGLGGPGGPGGGEDVGFGGEFGGGGDTAAGPGAAGAAAGGGEPAAAPGWRDYAQTFGPFAGRAVAGGAGLIGLGYGASRVAPSLFQSPQYPGGVVTQTLGSRRGWTGLSS